MVGEVARSGNKPSVRLGPQSLYQGWARGTTIILVIQKSIVCTDSCPTWSADNADRLWRRQTLSVDFTTPWTTPRKMEPQWDLNFQMLCNSERTKLTLQQEFFFAIPERLEVALVEGHAEKPCSSASRRTTRGEMIRLRLGKADLHPSSSYATEAC
jgi:hypothetical protein